MSSNYDENTDIHYGVISPNSISSEALDNLCFGANSTDPHYENGHKEIEDKINDFFKDIGCLSEEKETDIRDEILEYWSDHYENSDGQYDYEDTEYKLHISGDNFGIFVIKSPYYTYTRQCSPCAPNAGDLDNPISKVEYDKVGDYTRSIDVFGITHKIGLRSYCLDKSFFDPQYAKIPYRYYRVSDDTEVLEDIIEVD